MPRSYFSKFFAPAQEGPEIPTMTVTAPRMPTAPQQQQGPAMPAFPGYRWPEVKRQQPRPMDMLPQLLALAGNVTMARSGVRGPDYLQNVMGMQEMRREQGFRDQLEAAARQMEAKRARQEYERWRYGAEASRERDVFQRQYKQEELDLMKRMLGAGKEEKEATNRAMQMLVEAELPEQGSAADIKKYIAQKMVEVKGDPEMMEYLRRAEQRAYQTKALKPGILHAPAIKASEFLRDLEDFPKTGKVVEGAAAETLRELLRGLIPRPF